MNALKLIVAIILLSNTCVLAQNDKTYVYKSPSANGTGKFYLGREIAQVMSFEGVDWLERNTRSKEENTDLAISKLRLKKGDVVADIGAGSGYYTFRIARNVPIGKVYAVEIQDDAINYLKQKSSALKLNNVTVVKGNEQSPNLLKNSIDIAIMVDVYHELLFPHEYLQALKASLKPTGKLILLEYKEEDLAVAIKKEHKMSVQQVKKELLTNGFVLVQNGQFMPIQHFLVFQKKP
ncbi:class I SAM-dependent methyltransferase [Pedobacter mucosus]|uniref:class I SAM-dependent methyltransferase n=1 Tax=Pedobacter mucosus TaxID=2895286 RepID=UPI001EE4D74D|nr:methyltransferase domain-containing protein [Pedobacter mucosus]UKT65619.1 methyltransferase domain-containing protein [Pedobacter mucosus]